MDYLVLGSYLIEKNAAQRELPVSQPPPVKDSPATLRRFGLTIGFVFLFLGGLFAFRHRPAGLPLLSVAVLLLLFAAIAPSLLRFVYRPWMWLARVLGMISSSILLTILFFLVVTPIGLLQRLIGKPPLDLRFKSSQSTYWQRRTLERVAADYEKQF